MAVLLIIAIVFVAICGIVTTTSQKNGKEKSTNQFDEFKNNHSVSRVFITPAGYSAFCDDEQKLYIYRNVFKDMREIQYNSIIEYKYSKLSTGECFHFWATMPEYTEFLSGMLSSEDVKPFEDILSSITLNNQTQAIAEYNNKFKIPAQACKLRLKGHSGNVYSISSVDFNKIKPVYVWKKGSTLCFVPMFENLKKYRINNNLYNQIEINIKNIVDILQDGSVHYTTEISGGGGGGSSIKGAVIGGIIGGESGAIIGSRKATDPIKTTTKEIDDRATKIKILNDNNSYCELIFEHDNYYIIKKLLEE